MPNRGPLAPMFDTRQPPPNMTQEQWNKRLLISSYLFWAMAAVVVVGGALLAVAATAPRHVMYGLCLMGTSVISIFGAVRFRRYSRGK